MLPLEHDERWACRSCMSGDGEDCGEHEPKATPPHSLAQTRKIMAMTKDDIDALLSQINALVDNIDDPNRDNVRECAREIQRMAANLPATIEDLQRQVASAAKANLEKSAEIRRLTSIGGGVNRPDGPYDL